MPQEPRGTVRRRWGVDTPRHRTLLAHARARRAGGPPGAAAGQAAVELTLLIPVLLFMAMVMIDFGRSLAVAVSASNAAKQAAIFAAQNYISPLTCLQDDVNQLVSNEVSGLTSLTTITPTGSRAVISGEMGIQATVATTFTPITPFIKAFVNPLYINQRAADEYIPSPQYSLSITPSDPQLVSVHQMLDPTSSTITIDELSWVQPSSLYYSSTQYVQSGVTQTVSGQFLIYRSLPPSEGSTPNGCPYATQPMSITDVYTPTPAAQYVITTSVPEYVYIYDLDVPTASSPGGAYTPSYWVQAVGPAPSGFSGAADPDIVMATRN